MQTKEFKSIEPGDLIVVGCRTWRVTGIYLGCSGQENGIGLETTGDVSMPCVPGMGKAIREMIVPLDMIDARSIFRAVDHEAAKAGPRIKAVQ